MLEQALIVSTLVLFLIVGFLVKNKNIKTIGRFTLSRNNMGWFPVSAGISMTYAGGAGLLAIPSLGYTYGWWPLIDPISLFFGILVVIFFINKYRGDTGITISDLFSKADRKLSLLIGIVSTFVFTLILAAQFLALFKLIAPYFPEVSTVALTLVPAALTFSYVLLGGFSSVTKTDILQFFAISILFITPIIYFASTNNIVSDTPIIPKEMPINLMVMLALALVFVPVSQDINIRVKSAKSQSEAIKGLLIGSFIYAVIITSSIFMGVSLAENNIVIKDTEQVITTFFNTYYPQIGIFAILAAMAAIISTLDSYSLNTITVLSNDILVKFNFFKAKTEKQNIRIASALIFISASSIALFFNGILTLILAALLIYISILIPIALGKKMGISDNYIFISSLLLIGIIAIFEISGYEIDFKPFVYPVIGIGLMVLFSVSSKKLNKGLK
ncbi:sodium-solute symporter, putative [uncultured Candidatus Thioglobus sp.]|nr:sodium-solute symporter, putative [uncultured Candidatus Thioglobus sp.]